MSELKESGTPSHREQKVNRVDTVFRNIPRHQIGVDVVIGIFLVLVEALISRRIGEYFFGTGSNNSFSVEILHILVIAIAVAFRRLSPTLAIVFVWLSALVQSITIGTPSTAQFGTLLVLYSVAVYGSRFLFWTAAVSVPIGAVVAGLVLTNRWFLGEPLELRWYLSQLVTNTLAAFLALATAWLIGAVVRAVNRNRETAHLQQLSQAEAERARQIAKLQHDKAELARDVHDVLGHSLAVIIAHSDALQVLDSDDQESLRNSVRVIGDTARQALGEVRSVLSELVRDPDDSHGPSLSELPTLLQRIEATGAQIIEINKGQKISLTNSQETVLYRVVQELLTNALKHGDLRHPLQVSWNWLPALVEIQVTNTMKEFQEEAKKAPGNGLIGVRARLEQLAGRLTVTTESIETEARIFRATVVFPYGGPHQNSFPNPSAPPYQPAGQFSRV